MDWKNFPHTFRHTCPTGWASPMDPYTLAYLAGRATSLIHKQRRIALAKIQNFKGNWSGRGDSNSGPPGPEPGALPG